MLWVHRIYFFVVMWFTLWVGYIGFFRPQEILRALPWPVPPLHARFIGALYLSATVFLFLSMCAKSALRVRTIIWIAFAWTGLLLVVTIFHWSTFDFSRRQVWFWIVAYTLFPIGAAWLAMASPRIEPRAPTQIKQPWIIVLLRAQGWVLTAFAIAMFFTPSWVASFWPWKMSPFLAQVYAGPILGYAVGSLLLAKGGDWTEVLIPAVGILVGGVLALLASSWHLGLFAMGSLSAIIWFVTLAWFAAFAAGLVIAALAFARRDEAAL